MLRLADVFEKVIDERAPVGFRAYDGSSAGPADAEAVLEIRRPEAIAYIVTAPGELGLARAYVTGGLELHGDVHAALHALRAHARSVPWSERLRILRGIGPRALRRPPVPPEESPPRRRRGVRHSKGRDAAAISHHYDVSNRFYEFVLGPSMAYTCAVLPLPGRLARGGPGREVRPRLPQARPGARHAAARRRLRLGRHGHARRRALRRQGPRRDAVRAPGRVGAAGDRRARASGARRGSLPRLPRRRRIRFRRRFLDRPHRAHRRRNLGAYFRFLAGKLRPEGRMLNHTITRPSNLDRQRAGSSSTATSSQTANWRAPARSSRRCTTTASRCVTRRTSESTTR